MPLTLTVTEGVIPRDKEAEVVSLLTAAFLELHGVSGNVALIKNVIARVDVIPRERSYAGMEQTSIAIVEWKVPALMFSRREVQQMYVIQATEIVHDASGRVHPKERIWVNVTHAVDGAWGIGGKAYSNAELGAS